MHSGDGLGDRRTLLQPPGLSGQHLGKFGQIAK
jgi:hypothetical protein